MHGRFGAPFSPTSPAVLNQTTSNQTRESNVAQVFAITAVSTNVKPDAQGKGEASFTVSNVSGRTVRGRATAKAADPARQSWLSVVGETERE